MVSMVQTPKLRKEASKHSVAKAELSLAPVPVIRVISTLTRPQEAGQSLITPIRPSCMKMVLTVPRDSSALIRRVNFAEFGGF